MAQRWYSCVTSTAKPARLVDEARAIKNALTPFSVQFVVNDRVDVALAAGADGVHLGQDDMAVADARRLLGPGAIIGLSVKNAGEAEAAPIDLIDYVGSGGVYVTLSKQQKNPPIGPEGLGRIIAVLKRRAGQTQQGPAGLRHCRDRCEQCRRGDSRRRGGRRRDLGAVAQFRPGRRVARHAASGRRGAIEARRVMGVPIALSIAGSDSGGGAGIEADLKTFSALGVYGACVVTAVTAQNTKGVSAIHAVPAEIVAAQIDAVLSDFDVGAIKIGMLANAAIVEAVAAGLGRHATRNVVLDPILAASTGAELLRADALDALRLLIPNARVFTPNLFEAAALLEVPMAQDESEMHAQAEKLLALGAGAVLIKGGHGGGTESVDLLVDGETNARFAAPRVATKNTHGTGCTLASAIAAGLAKGLSLNEAVGEAKAYVTAAIAAADRLHVGSGHGPLHHFHKWW